MENFMENMAYTLAKNKFASAKLKTYDDCTLRVVFYDSDDKFFDYWVLEDEDCSDMIEELVKMFAIDCDEIMKVHFHNAFPDLRIFKPETFSEYIETKEKYGDDFINRIGRYVFVCKE